MVIKTVQIALSATSLLVEFPLFDLKKYMDNFFIENRHLPAIFYNMSLKQVYLISLSGIAQQFGRFLLFYNLFKSRIF